MKNTHLIYLRFSWIFSLLMSTVFSFGQSDTPSIQKGLLKGNLLFAPSFTYELGITKNLALKAEAGVSLTVFDNFGDTSVAFFPKFEGQFKHYYNLKRRIEKGKNITGNSGSFIAAVYNFQDSQSIFSDVNRNTDFSTLGGVWGFQRSYDSGLSLLFEIGFGYDFTYRSNARDTNGRPFPLIGFELGWVLFKH